MAELFVFCIEVDDTLFITNLLSKHYQISPMLHNWLTTVQNKNPKIAKVREISSLTLKSRKHCSKSGCLIDRIEVYEKTAS